MRKLLLCVLAAIMLVACGKDDFSFNVKEEIKNPYAVTPEEAVQLLQTVIGDETTRSVSISDVQTLTKGNFTQTTRSGADDEVIYIVDIEGGGSAIMGADKRMEPIYAVLDNTKITAEQLVGATTRSESEGEDIEDYVLGLLNNAILSDIQEVETAGVEMPLIPRDQTWSVTNITARQTPLLNTKWHQGYPYNTQCPPINGQESKAGCGPIAAAQIIYYNRFPYSILGHTCNWNLISAFEYGQGDYQHPLEIEEIATFVYKIGLAMGVTYREIDSTLGTTNTSQQAESFFNSIGYSDVSLIDYSLPQVIDMVYNKQLPVYMLGHYYDANNPLTVYPGHDWVIDGCNVYTIDYWVRHYTDAINYTEYIESTVNYNLVHCNYGNAGLCDGYYTNHIFDTTSILTSDRIDSENGDVQHQGSYYYDKILQLITYSLD